MSGGHWMYYLRTFTDENGDIIVYGSPHTFRKIHSHISFFHYSYIKGTNKSKCYAWYIHRIGKPSYISDKVIGWYVHGAPHAFTIQYCEACGFSQMETMKWVLKYGEYLPRYVGDIAC